MTKNMVPRIRASTHCPAKKLENVRSVFLAMPMTTTDVRSGRNARTSFFAWTARVSFWSRMYMEKMKPMPKLVNPEKMDTAAETVLPSTEVAPFCRKPTTCLASPGQSISTVFRYSTICGYWANSRPASSSSPSTKTGMLLLRLIMVLNTSGVTTKTTRNRTPDTRARVISRLAGRCHLFLSPFFPMSSRSTGRMGTLRAKAMAPPIRNGKKMWNSLATSSRHSR